MKNKNKIRQSLGSRIFDASCFFDALSVLGLSYCIGFFGEKLSKLRHSSVAEGMGI